jgi:dipeptidyl aminopeptidase/acylaminoacyl peptidase
MIVLPSSTPIPSTTPIPSATSTPAPESEPPLSPYTQTGLRTHDYRFGKVKLGAVLKMTDSYVRYAITYPSDGLTISGGMQVPVGSGPFPVIIMNHGFFLRGEYAPGAGTERAAEFLSRHGYLTIAPDYRTWGESDDGVSIYSSGPAIDVINLLNALPSIPKATPSRVGAWGHSMGGGITLKVLTLDPRIKAAVLYSPISADMADTVERWGLGCIGLSGPGLDTCPSADVLPPDVSPELVQAYRDSAADPDLLRQFSPINYLENIVAPLQIHVGLSDGKAISETPPGWALKMDQALLEAGRDVEYYTYIGQGHSFQGEDWDLLMLRTVEFFNKWVKGGG